MISRSVAAGVLARIGRLGADRMPMLTAVLRRWPAALSGLDSARSPLLHVRFRDQRLPVEIAPPAVVQGRRTQSAFRSPERVAPAPPLQMKAAPVIQTRSQQKTAAGSADKGRAARANSGSSPSDPSESTDPNLTAPWAGERPLDAVKAATDRGTPVEKLRRKTAANTADPEGSARSVPFLPSPPPAQAKPLTATGVKNAALRSDHPTQPSPVQKRHRVSIPSRFGNDLPDGPVAAAKMRQSDLRKSGIAGDMVFTKIAPQILAHPALSARTAARRQEHIDRNDRQPTRLNVSSAQAPLNAKQSDQVRQIHPSARARSGAAAVEVRQPAASRRSSPSEYVPGVLPGAGIQTKAAPPQPAGIPIVHRKIRRFAADGAVGRKVDRGDAAQAAPAADPLQPAGIPIVHHNIRRFAADGAVGRKVDRGDATQAAPSDSPIAAPAGAGQLNELSSVGGGTPGGRENIGMQKIERHLRTAVIARFADNAPAENSRRIRNGDGISMHSLGIQSLQRTGPSPIHSAVNSPFAQRRPPQPSNHARAAGADTAIFGAEQTQTPLIKVNGRLTTGPTRMQRSIGDDDPAAPAVAPAIPKAASRQWLPALPPDRTAGLIVASAFRPADGIAATSAASPFLTAISPNAMLSTQRLPDSRMVHRSASTNTGMPAKARHPGVAPTIFATSGGGMLQRESPSWSPSTIDIALAPLMIQRQSHPAWEIQPSFKAGRPEFQDHPGHFAPALPIHTPENMIHLKLGPTARPDRRPWPMTQTSPGVDRVFRAPAGEGQTASSPAAGRPNGTLADTVNFGFPENTAGGASIDLERLADEIYAIIERRLTIERESLGQ